MWSMLVSVRDNDFGNGRNFKTPVPVGNILDFCNMFIMYSFYENEIIIELKSLRGEDVCYF